MQIFAIVTSFFVLFFLFFLLFLKKDFLAPVFVIGIPMSISYFLYTLRLSDFYCKVGLEFWLLFVSFVLFLMGLISSGFRKKNSFNAESFLRRIDYKKTAKVIWFFLLMAILVFVVEANFVTPPLISNTPNKNYMEFGLPVIHNFIYLLFLNTFLSYIYYKGTGFKKLLMFNISASIIIFSLLTQRLCLLFLISILFSSYALFENKFFNSKILFKFFIFIFGFVFIFNILGGERLGGLTPEYIIDLTRVSKSSLDTSYAMLYIYLTSGIQNTINYLAGFKSCYLGLGLIFDTLPLLDSQIFRSFKLCDYQILVNFTTFIYPVKFIIDFGYFFPLFSLVFSFFISRCYIYSLRGGPFWLMFFITYCFPRGLFLSFSDVFFSSSLFVFVLSLCFVNKIIFKF